MSAWHRFSLKYLATWFGCGHSPLMPGTVGTLGAFPLVWFFYGLGEMAYLAATLLFCVFAILVAHLYEMEIAGVHDTPELVIDEVAGFLVTMAMVPLHWNWLLLGFLLFRFFDILKPFPISWVDRRVLGGVGAVADDLVAGILSSLVLQLVVQNYA